MAQVILNRMRHPTYPNSVCGVIYQGSERATGCQFSYSCDGSMARIPARASWLRAQHVAAQALAGSVYAPVGMATHYHATYVYPYWAPSLNFHRHHRRAPFLQLEGQRRAAIGLLPQPCGPRTISRTQAARVDAVACQ